MEFLHIVGTGLSLRVLGPDDLAARLGVAAFSTASYKSILLLFAMNQEWKCVGVKSWSSRVVLGDPSGSNKAERLVLLNLIVKKAENLPEEQVVVEVTYEKARLWLQQLS